MNVGVLVLGGVTVLAIYTAAVLQYSGAVVAADHMTWIVGLGVLAAGAGLAGRALL